MSLVRCGKTSVRNNKETILSSALLSRVCGAVVCELTGESLGFGCFVYIGLNGRFNR